MVDQQLLLRLQSYYEERLEDMVVENIAVCEVAAPSFQEHARAEYVAQRWRDLGLTQVWIDDTPNVYAEIYGRGAGPTILLAAHLDTVFPAGTDVTVRRIRHELHALAYVIIQQEWRRLFNWLLAAGFGHTLARTPNFGGHSRGRGAGRSTWKAAMAHFADAVDMVIAVDGNLGSVVHAGIASRRLQVRLATGGGHSWGDFGSPSAIHALGRMVADISRLKVPHVPRTTYNVGVIEGGTSINTIAPTAEMLLDMRSVAVESLTNLEEQVRAILVQQAQDCQVQMEINVVGDRPGGAIPATHPLVQLGEATLAGLGIKASLGASSTDANVPLSQGIPAICVGITHGQGAHRMDESLDIRPIPLGMAQLTALVISLLK